MSRKKGTSTRAFGASSRESHDASAFYNSRLYSHVRVVDGGGDENPVPAEALDKIVIHSSEDMVQLPDRSVHLMITSPPYNATKEYDEDLSLAEYRDMLRRVFAETYRVLVPGGRACVNIANLGRKPYIPLHSYIIEDMLALGFLMRGEIIWNKGSSAGASTAWGSWLSASNPTLRDVHEYIMVFSKGQYARKPKEGQANTIAKEQFLEYTKSLWSFDAESARRVQHPAPFPIELPHRLIQLYSFTGDVVLDPFTGSGSTLIAACRAQRHYVGYEIHAPYAAIAEARLDKERGLFFPSEPAPRRGRASS